MVFSSAPLYLDPHNWHHHQQQVQIHHQHQQQSQQLNTTACTHGGGGVVSGGDNNHTNHQISIHMPPPVPSQAVGGGNTNSIRPGSMADRARQAKIPQPEPGLKCPRCQSTNTKFCYFNNYSLTQPRHFCKMCRRYWTKGGALRNVPVGGGFRKNNKRSSKKAGGGVPKEMGEHQAGTGPNHNSASPLSSSSNYDTDTNNNNNFNHGNMLDSSASIASQSFQLRMTQFPLLAHGQYESPTSNNLGHNFGGMISATAQAELGFQTGSSVSSVNADHQWTPNHFPNNFLAAFDPAQFSHRPSPSSGLYHFPIGHQSSDQQASSIHVPPGSSSFNMKQHQHVVRPSSMPLKNSTDQKDNEAAAVKAEEAAAATCQGGMNSLSRSFLGMSDSSQYWNANNNSTNTSTWTDHSGINSTSSTTQRPL